ncbi:myocardial zonula adherens protein [Neoarius graeffei]|uniref:myocardial zonula adherens protein n=1 Tax=Neoarius graeffei TaxID=443677 RepID=UPI00298D3200|nr:myocardial zonula adherens protein [Neoarius graeffei]
MKPLELLDMETQLQQEGLCFEASSDLERLDCLWRLFIEKDNSVRKFTQELQTKHAAEISTFQLYIRNLSKTRDSMALELERENEMLRSNLIEINLQQEAQKSEIAEMLVQEGLAELIASSLSEQVAYLLADQAALREKIQALEDRDSDTRNVQCAQKQRTPDENAEKVTPLQRWCSWKRSFRKASQATKDDNQATKDKTFKDGERSLLERDLDEASTRLNLAHKEIRRLIDELESAHVTKKTYESELHGAQVEAEQLRQELEKLKHCDLDEVQAVKETNELHHLRDTVHTMHAERAQLLELIERNFKELDSEDEDLIHALTQKLTPVVQTSRSLSRITSGSCLKSPSPPTHKTHHTRPPPKGKNKKEKDVHKRYPEKLEEGLSSLQELNLKFEAELEQETMMRKKIKEAEQQILELQDTTSSMQHLQQKSSQEQENLKPKQDIKKLEDFCEELQQVQNNLHSQARKYEMMKVHHREKLGKAKRVHLQELTWRDQKITEQEGELDILTKRLEKESDLVKMVMAENEALLLTKKTLLEQLNEAEENSKNTDDQVFALRLRVELLEKNNIQQWEMNMLKSVQIFKLERLLWDMESLRSIQYLRKIHRNHLNGPKLQ